MKTPHIFKFTISGLLALCLCLSSTAAFALGQEKGSAKGGAMMLAKSPARGVQQALHKDVSCPDCKDRAVKHVDSSARGMIKPAVISTKHLCKGCSTERSIVGQGKSKHELAVHTCTARADLAACCSR